MGEKMMREKSERISKWYKDLIAWQKGMGLCEKIYKITGYFPKEELYGLVSQMRRAVISIPSNLAEGQLRNSSKEFRQFISIALGSCGELKTQLELAKRLGFIKDELYDTVSKEINEEMKILHGLRRKLTSK